MDDLFCWRWARRSTWRSIYVNFYAGAWAAEAWTSDVGQAARSFATADGATPEAALRSLSVKLEQREPVMP